MLTIGIIILIFIISFKNLRPLLLNRISILILIYSAILILQIIMEGYDILILGIEIYGGLTHLNITIILAQITILLCGAMLLALGEWKNNKKEGISVPAEYNLIILISVLGSTILLTSNDLVSIFLSIELQSFPLYILASFYKWNKNDFLNGLDINRDNQSSIAAGLKYLYLGALSSSLLLLGSAIIYGYTGLTNLSDITLLIGVGIENDFISLENISISYKLISGFMLIGIALLFKIGAVPFHNWAPDVYDGVPTIVTSWIAIMPKISIIVFIAILYLGLGNCNYLGWNYLLLISSFGSLLIGSLLGLVQYRIKRLLSYSSISHIGFILLNLGIINISGIGFTYFYLIVYVITSINIFLIIMSLNKSINIETISQLKGQIIQNPILSIILTICIFSLAGVPPFIGFFAKLYILLNAIDNSYYFLAFIAIFSSVISASVYLRFIKIIHFDEYININSALPYSIKLNESISSIISILTLFIITFIFYPQPILFFINQLYL